MNPPQDALEYLEDLIDKAQATNCFATMCVYERKYHSKIMNLIAQGYSISEYIHKFWDVFYGGKR